jgi:beta-galactosidase
MKNYCPSNYTGKGIDAAISGNRIIQSLNGTWDCEEATDITKDIIPDSWSHSIIVPGLVDMASPAVKNYDYVFYRKKFTVNRNVADNVILKLYKGCYGKKIWLNGKMVGEHHYNFTPAYFNLTQYINGSEEENELIIRVGKRDRQSREYGRGFDCEKQVYTPGIFDGVELFITGNQSILNVQTAPEIKNSRVRVLARIKNNSSSTRDIITAFRIYEVNTNNLVGYCIRNAALEAGKEGMVECMAEINNCHLWTPEDPFFYNLEVTTGDDKLNVKFGMRTFQFDAKTKKPLLNGDIYMLRGTNITMYRFFEDPERGCLPWDKEWARKIIRKFKSLNMNCARFSLGFPPEIWYEVADEEGFLVQDEYPIWGWEEGMSIDAVSEEAMDWIFERSNHPCVIIWDIQNESIDERTTEVIKNVRNHDIQNRPWDNGWSSKLLPTDTEEKHLYWYDNNPYWKVEQLEEILLVDQYIVPNNPIVFNEYGWLWLNRDGTPTKASAGIYNLQMPGSTVDERRLFCARTLAMKSEFWRANRYAMVAHFCGLSYSKDGGVTSDNFLPGLNEPRFEPYFEKYMHSAFAPVGIMIYKYDSIYIAESKVSIPVYVSNDRSIVWSGKVTFKVVQGLTVITSMIYEFKKVPTGYRADCNFEITIPPSGNYQMIAEYMEGNAAVQSVRDFTSMTRVETDRLYGCGFKRPVFASSEHIHFPKGSIGTQPIPMKANRINDGDEHLTRWSSDFNDDEWICIDLESPKEISRVKLVWEASYGKEYKIQVSSNAIDWTDIYYTVNGQGGTENLHVSGTGRYVRMLGIKSATECGYSLWEMQVFEI